MVYDCSPTQLTLALIPTFAGLLHMHLASTGTEMLPGEALRDLETRVQALAIMTRDQLMCLAAELLPPDGVRTLMQHLGVLHGFGEWDEIRRRRPSQRTEIAAGGDSPLEKNKEENIASSVRGASSLTKRQTKEVEGGDPPPTAKAKSGDLNVHRITVAVTKQLREEQEDASWFRFPYSSPNALAKKGEKAFHGTHLECLHAILATGRILPSSSVIEGARHFEGRPGVNLHKEVNRHLAAGYALLTRCGPKNVLMRAMLEVLYDIDGSQKKGKQTNQLILAYDSVQITAVLLQIVTKEHMQLGDHIREWSGGLEVPLESTKEAFASLGLEKTWQPDVGYRSRSIQSIKEGYGTSKLQLETSWKLYAPTKRGHSRTDVDDEAVLEVLTEEQLPEEIIHGTQWNGVILTAEDVPPEAIVYFQSLRDQAKYD
ncbi:unnamed protein product, partial [Symbiodinium sp. CCMP2456]